MKNGFTLIELLIVIVLASFLLTIMFGSFVQSNKLVNATNSIIDVQMKLTVASHQFMRDISGSCVPSTVYSHEQTENKSAEDIKNLFVASANQQLDFLTFISNNPLKGYWSDKIGKPYPHLVRIVYRLIREDNEEPASFKLMRQSDENLDFNAYDLHGKIRAYELLSGIKSMSLTFSVVMETEDTTTKELQILKTWNSNTQAILSNDKPIYIPNSVTIFVALWNDTKIDYQEFTIQIPVFADSRIEYQPDTITPPLEELKKTKSMVLLPSTEITQIELEGIRS